MWHDRYTVKVKEKRSRRNRAGGGWMYASFEARNCTRYRNAARGRRDGIERIVRALRRGHEGRGEKLHEG